MRKQNKKFLAFFLSAAIAFSGLGFSGTEVKASGFEGTVVGDAVTVAVSSDVASERETNFNSGWKFYLGNNNSASNQNFDDSSWNQVTLPHDFSISQNFTTSGEAESGFLPGGTGWYRKSFTMSQADEGKTVVLSFDGVYNDAYVYVNGTQVGENHYGYNSFAFDITDYLTYDGATENVIAVKAVNNIPSSRWYSGSGIYRDVTLLVTDPVHVAMNGTYVTTPDIASGRGTVSASVELNNDRDQAVSAVVKNTIRSANGAVVATAADQTVTIASNASVTANANVSVSNPTLWDLDNPVQYTLHTEVYVDGTMCDSYDTDFGFRYFSFNKTNGFYLNGKAVKLNGVCLHHDQGAAGSAAYYDAMYRQLSIMKDMGANAIRTSHNIADEHFIDICNELGLLVIEEAFDGWTYAKNGNSNDFSRYFNTKLSSDNKILGGDSNKTWSQFAIQSMVKRDRNDPSIIMWSLCNEVQEGGSSDSTYPTIAQNLISWIKALDTTRLVTIGDNTRSTSASGNIGGVLSAIQTSGGVLGFNYGSDPYSSLNSAWTAPIYASETSSATNSRGVYSTQASNSLNSSNHLTSYDTSAVSWGTTAHDSMYRVLTKDYVAGEFVWTGFDYIGEPTPKNGTGSGDTIAGAGPIPNSSYFGIVETTGFPKDTYYLYRAQWNQKDTTLHLVTAWDSDNMLTTSGKTPVVVYSNAPTVKLFLNGTQIGTATRKVNTTSAGHSYYTYTTTSNNNSTCSAVSASGSASLYATFNVAYTAGTISAVAYDESGNEITETSGNKVVSTPGTVTALQVSQNKTNVDADGQSLTYVEVSVVDANGNLDTTASNTINFSVSGKGEIVGVDNGDQATTAKYQQASVIDSKTSAHINAYAGKALVIVKSTQEAGSFTVDVTSSGLTGGKATVTTNAVSSVEASGLTSYTLVRDYTVMAGVVPSFKSEASATVVKDGKTSTIGASVQWDNVSADIYTVPGDYNITGTITFEDKSIEALQVIGKLHVIANVIAMRNVSTVTMQGIAPVLPDTVMGLMADGSLAGEFAVTWENLPADQFDTIGDIVTVNGTATVIGSGADAMTLPVTCSVRVAEAVNTDSVNVATAAYVTQDVPDGKQSDNLASVNDGEVVFIDNTSKRWTNWNNRYDSETAGLTFTWDTAQLLSEINIAYYVAGNCQLPKDIKFEYSLDGVEFTEIGYTNNGVIDSGSYGSEYNYSLDSVINPVAVRITFTQSGGTSEGKCFGVTEVEMMTYAGRVEVNTSAALSEIKVDGDAVDGFAAGNYNYTVSSSQDIEDVTVAAASADNAGITVLPAYTEEDGTQVIRIITVSEDGTASDTYAVAIDAASEPACKHENTEVRGASAATCTAEGYTGDIWCTECGEKITEGSVIPATGHSCTTQGYKAATCTVDGYTGDQVCSICGEIVSKGSVIKAAGHKYNSGVVTKPATETETGIKTFTCSVCGDSYTEVIPVVIKSKIPKTTIQVTKGSAANKIVMTGKFTDYKNIQDYTITEHGILYIQKTKLGAKTLTITTSGRTKVSFNTYKADGSFVYTLGAASATTKYVVRSYISYTDENGKTQTVYSPEEVVTYSGLK